MTLLIANVFGGQGGKTKMPVIHVAVMDQDDDFLSRAVRSMSGQGDAAKQLQVHYVDKRVDGIRLIEDREVTAFIVLPPKMTANLLNGKTNVIELYENPAEQVLPKVVRQGTLLTAAGLSGLAELLGEPLRETRDLFESKSFPAETAVSDVATRSAEKLKGLKTYLFPPIIVFTNVPAADWRPL
jgi:hypothetical protein